MLDYHGLKEWIRMECEGVSMKAVFVDEDSIDGPYTTGKTI